MATDIHYGASEEALMLVRENLATCLCDNGRKDDAVAMLRMIYAKSLALGDSEENTFGRGLNLAISLKCMGSYTEAKSFLREQLPKARDALGAEDCTYIKLRATYAQTLYFDNGASRDDVVEASTILEELVSTTRRVLGPSHPLAQGIMKNMMEARMKLLSLGAV